MANANKRILSSPLVWESSDIEESFEKRKYLYVRNILCVLDESKYNKIFVYEKGKTKLGYDVYLKYDKHEDYITISFLTSHMILDDKIVCEYSNIDSTCAIFCEMVMYPCTPSKNRYNSIFQAELIRERSGRVLDNFFLYLLPDDIQSRFVLERSGEFDPMDGIGNFIDNPEYMNGGFDYFAPVKNDFIYDITDDENNMKKSISLYNGNLLDHDDKKVQDVINDISDKVVGDISPYDTNIYNGLKNFVNIFFDGKNSTWFDYGTFSFRKSFDVKKWNSRYGIYNYATIIQYKNRLTKSTGFIDFDYNHNDGTLFESPNTYKKENIINTYIGINDKYLKYFIFINFISDVLTDKDLLANKEINKFIEIVIEYGFPEDYIDGIFDILADESEDMEKKLSMYISFAIIPYKKTCYMYSKILYDLIPYFLNGITTGSISEYSLNKLKNPFDNVDSFLTGNALIEQMSYHYFPTDLAIRILYSYKIVHQRHQKNMLLSQILKLAGSFKTDHSVKNSHIDYMILYKKQEILMMSVLISKLSNSAINDHAIVPHYVFDIFKFYLRNYRQFSSDWIYDGKSYHEDASKYDINLIVTLNMLVNRMIKKPEDQVMFTKVIQTINYLVGGRTSWVYASYGEPMKVFSFFMLNIDRLDEHLLDRYNILIRKLAVPYNSVCRYPFGKTIKNQIISHMMPLLWQKKMTDAHFDDLEEIAKLFEGGHHDRNTYEIVKNKINAYLIGI